MRYLGAGGAGFIGSHLIFIGQALQEQSTIIDGTGEQTRSFCYRSEQVIGSGEWSASLDEQRCERVQAG
jgi:nucleoside-diphosphate-sugar epimerase